MPIDPGDQLPRPAGPFLDAVDGRVDRLETSAFDVERRIGAADSPVIVVLAPPPPS
jgi:hypothetical protein